MNCWYPLHAIQTRKNLIIRRGSVLASRAEFRRTTPGDQLGPDCQFDQWRSGYQEGRSREICPRLKRRSDVVVSPVIAI
jgi:hypothetical protein